MSESIGESTVERFIVDDGMDSLLDMEVKILTAGGIDRHLVHLVHIRPVEESDGPGLGLTVSVELLDRIHAEVQRRTSGQRR